MGFEFFGIGKAKAEKPAEEKAPEKTIEEMEAYAKEQGFSGTPAKFEGVNPHEHENGIDWQDPDTLPDVEGGIPYLQGKRDEAMFNKINRE